MRVEPPIQRSLLIALKAAGKGLVWNSGSGLRLAVPVGFESAVGEHVRVEPCNPPVLKPSKPWRVSELSIEVSSLRLGAAWFKVRDARRLVAELVKQSGGEVPLLSRSWVFSVQELGYTCFQVCAIEFTPNGGLKPTRRLLKLRKPSLLYAPMLLSPDELLQLVKGLSRRMVVNPVGRGEVEMGSAALVKAADDLYLGFRKCGSNSLLAVGNPGTGKSVFIDYLLSQLSRYKWPGSILVLDPTGEHAVLAQYGFRVLEPGVDALINPLTLGVEVALEVVEGATVELKGLHWGYGPGSYAALREALESSSTLFEAARRLRSRAHSGGEWGEMAQAALRRLLPVLHPSLAGWTPLPEGRVVLVMPRMLRSLEQRLAFTIALLRTVYWAAYRRSWSGLVVVEEADRLGPGCAALSQVVDELRKFDVHVWAVAHDVSRVPAALQGCRHRFFFQCTAEGAAKYLNSLGFESARVATLPKLTFLDCYGYERVVPYLPGFADRLKELGEPVDFDGAARDFGLDRLELMELYALHLPHAREIVKFALKQPMTAEELDAVRGLNLDGVRVRALARLYLQAFNRPSFYG